MKVCSFFLLVLLAAPVFSGTFRGSQGPIHGPFVVVHPEPYTSAAASGSHEVKICADGGANAAVPAIISAIEAWNNLTPLEENCINCRTWEEGPSGSSQPLSMSSVILHELGHCVFGLSHPNQDDSSFSAVRDETSVSAGTDGLPGSADDIVTPLPGASLLHWFRTADNDPAKVDFTLIDKTTYSRAISNLPSGSSWPANANRVVTGALGYDFLQSVLYSSFDIASYWLGLSADEVNMVKFARTGVDQTAGTADDYTTTAVFTGYDCSEAHVQVSFEDIGGDFGLCTDQILVELPNQGLIKPHHRLQGVDNLGNPAPAKLKLSAAENWDAVFASSFETGDPSEWN